MLRNYSDSRHRLPKVLFKFSKMSRSIRTRMGGHERLGVHAGGLEQLNHQRQIPLTRAAKQDRVGTSLSCDVDGRREIRIACRRITEIPRLVSVQHLPALRERPLACALTNGVRKRGGVAHHLEYPRKSVPAEQGYSYTRPSWQTVSILSSCNTTINKFATIHYIRRRCTPVCWYIVWYITGNAVLPLLLRATNTIRRKALRHDMTTHAQNSTATRGHNVNISSRPFFDHEETGFGNSGR